jgi:ferrochelatase
MSGNGPADRGVLLVNLGTPESPATRHVRRYLDEFLSDPRVLDINPVLRALLVKTIIVPLRGPKSASTYRRIWTEEGSPLLHYGSRVRELLQERLGPGWQVELAMRYGRPEIGPALERLRRAQPVALTVLPLFPQYASATVGSIHQKVMNHLSRWQTMPELRLVCGFHDNPKVVEAFAERGRRHAPEAFDHVLFSFHGLPERQLLKADDSGRHCLQRPDCCRVRTPRNRLCYGAQCTRTAEAISERLGLRPTRYTVTFQSRLGREPWLEPSTSETLTRLAAEGARRVMVFCPSFVADCLETLFEIGVENDHAFRAAGGEKVQLVESLNDSPLWVEALADIVAG